jgi:hypothetical protein
MRTLADRCHIQDNVYSIAVARRRAILKNRKGKLGSAYLNIKLGRLLDSRKGA